MADNLLKVQPIRNGTVIDHLRAGAGLKILDILDVAGTGNTVSLLINVPSSKQGRKDIIKIEDRELTESETERIALLSPSAHVNIIRNYSVAEKTAVEIPEEVAGVARCPNTNCISNNERGATSRLLLRSREPLQLACAYCARLVAGEELQFL
ncbi:MAG: aspartate carbamoyltransferase regulatory subunit [Candidatus Poseidoniia archaeon]|jgi:aspartate carbamoyltransferase regulatory subunit|uniref:Aspartate carbamoyltransferase regulatory chain n=1 Tax=Marine Group III euryarchaeote TaxID=2173149 RepID=A0A7C8DFQ6_9ARCH|nr:MAG: aspartate carbamoyltransferase regulatory subunit [Euryarchaeota archaeon]HIG63030.1 aspartate carbamoyltransferase regulatory subunit [Marine Group III euryarchaeote]HIL32710.1 aspartate carbamoyltransferase regulatory subunit [Candidatus Poseidoniales archaeon]